MNEFTKKTAPVPGGPVPVLGQQPQQVVYKLEVLFNSQGRALGVVIPQDMALPIVIDHLAAGIQRVSQEMMTRMQNQESRIVVPKIAGIKPLNG